ncbi:hypothetical protein QQ045_017306 [Rhodiola kirilowii]
MRRRATATPTTIPTIAPVESFFVFFPLDGDGDGDGIEQGGSGVGLCTVANDAGPVAGGGLNAITTSLNQIGDTFEKAFEEGKTIVENKTADFIQQTRKLQIRRKGWNSETHNQISGAHTTWQPLQHAQPQIQTTQETQHKASRDIAVAEIGVPESFDPVDGTVRLIGLKESGFYHLLPRLGFLKASIF